MRIPAPFITISALSMLLATDAAASQCLFDQQTNEYYLTSRNPNFVEIDGSDKGFGSPTSLIAAFRMGAWGMATLAQEGALNIEVHKESPPWPESIEDTLLGLCQGKSVPTTSWPEGCSPQGIVLAVTEHFAQWGQMWRMLSFGISKQTLALNNQVNVMKSPYDSPVVAPIYGHVDHWIAVRRMNFYDAACTNLKQVQFFDGGYGDGVKTDQLGKLYLSGLRKVAAELYKQDYYMVIPTEEIDPWDPNVNKFIFAYDPPPGARLPTNPPMVTFHRGAVVVEPGEMTVELAPVLVWDALDAEGMLDDPTNDALILATPGDAWLVHGKRPSGAPWDYIVVPMYADEAMQSVTALVGLSAYDGAFEQVFFLDGARQLDLPDAATATTRAAAMLRPGETLGAGRLIWDPACGAGHCSEPMLPYHEFPVAHRGQATARITIPMGGLQGHRD